MNVDGMTEIVVTILALSAASERLVAIIKRLVPYLDQPRANAAEEKSRVLALQVISLIAGIFTAILASTYLFGAPLLENKIKVLGLGLLASGGSDFWNSVLGYLNSAKDIKKKEGMEAKTEIARLSAGVSTANLAPKGPTSRS